MNALYMQLLNTQLWLNHIIATVKSSHLKYCDFAEGKISLSIITKTKLFRDTTHLGKNIKIYPISLQSFHQCSRGVKQKKNMEFQMNPLAVCWCPFMLIRLSTSLVIGSTNACGGMHCACCKWVSSSFIVSLINVASFVVSATCNSLILIQKDDLKMNSKTCNAPTAIPSFLQFHTYSRYKFASH